MGVLNKHTVTMSHIKTAYRLKQTQGYEKERQQEQNVLVLHCYKSPRLALAPKTQQAYHKIFGPGRGRLFG